MPWVLRARNLRSVEYIKNGRDKAKNEGPIPVFEDTDLEMFVSMKQRN